MLDRVKKVAGLSLATSMVLAVTGNNAQAYDFNFSGFTAGTHSASGTFRISDTATPGAITP